MDLYYKFFFLPFCISYCSCSECNCIRSHIAQSVTIVFAPGVLNFVTSSSPINCKNPSNKEDTVYLWFSHAALAHAAYFNVACDVDCWLLVCY